MQIIVQICKPCTHIIIVQIIIDNVELHYINIYKHEIRFEIVCIDIQGWKMHYKNIYREREIKFDYKSKYIAQAIFNKKFLYLNKRSSQK
jgi:hypothetical protein